MQAATSRSPICGPSEYYGYAFDQQPPIKDVAELLENHAVRVTVRSGEFSGARSRFDDPNREADHSATTALLGKLTPEANFRLARDPGAIWTDCLYA